MTERWARSTGGGDPGDKAEHRAGGSGGATIGTSGVDRARDGRRNRLQSVLQIAVAVGLVAALVYATDIGWVARLIASANVPLLLVAVTASLGDRLFMIGKWYPLLSVQEANVSPVTAGRAYFAAGFASIFLPASVGGDVLRAVALGRAKSKVVEVGASIVVERVLGLLGSGVMCLVAGALAVRAGIRLDFVLPWALAAVAVAVTALAAPILVDERSRFGRWLARHDHWPGIGLVRRLADAYALYGRHVRLLAIVAALSTVEQLMPIVGLWLVSHALATSIELHMLLVAAPLTMFVARLPIAAWGLGVMEGALVFLLGLFGVPPAEALAVSLCGRVVDVAAMLPGAVLWRDLVRSPADSRPVAEEFSGGKAA